MKTKYLIINTWNGEGYSEPNIRVESFDSESLAIAYGYKEALACCEGSKSFPKVNKNTHGFIEISYEFSSDQGCIHMFEFGLIPKDALAIIVKPMVNDFSFICDDDTLDIYRNEAIDSEDWDGKLYMEYFHGDDHDFYLIDRNQPDLFLLYDDDQCGDDDGVESETWYNIIDGSRYSVPIEIVRDFDNAKKYE